MAKTAIRKLVRGARAWNPFRRKRRIHAYGIGAAKTGTTSLASIFEKNFRAVHEPATGELIDMFQREKDCPLVDALQEIEPDNLTPRQALERLYKLKAMAGDHAL